MGLQEHHRRDQRAAHHGTPPWLERARAQARRTVMQVGGAEVIEVRDEVKDGKVVAIVVETRHNFSVPASLKTRNVTKLFVKLNIRFMIQNETVANEQSAGRCLVVVREDGKITGLPVTKAQAGKLRRGYRYFVITSEPNEEREFANRSVTSSANYDESNYWIGWYTPKGGHRHDDEKGGELVAEFRNELFVLQFLFENGLEGLYEIDELATEGFLPVTDARRWREKLARLNPGAPMPNGRPFPKPPQHYSEASYHRNRLAQCFADLYRESVADEDELAIKVREVMAATVIGKSRELSTV